MKSIPYNQLNYILNVNTNFTVVLPPPQNIIGLIFLCLLKGAKKI